MQLSVVILAAGQGKRMNSDLPKVLQPLAGEPLLKHVINAARSLDITAPPLDRDDAKWTHPIDYGACQDLADSARQAEIEVIRYRSVRDPERGMNLAVLTPAVFASTPESPQTWRLFVASRAVQAFREMPPTSIEYTLEDWAADPRVAAAIA